MCCLSGMKVSDLMERSLRLVRPNDYYLCLLIHMGTNNTARHGLDQIIKGYEDLGQKVKEFGAQVVFLWIPLVGERVVQREQKLLRVNEWLRRWS